MLSDQEYQELHQALKRDAERVGKEIPDDESDREGIENFMFLLEATLENQK